MVASRPEIAYTSSQTRKQCHSNGYTYVLDIWQPNGIICNTVPNRKLKIPDGGLNTGNMSIISIGLLGL